MKNIEDFEQELQRVEKAEQKESVRRAAKKDSKRASRPIKSDSNHRVKKNKWKEGE